MSLENLKTQIAARIASVDGIAAENVHKWMRYTPTWNKMYEFFKVGGDDGVAGVINGWVIEVEAATGEWKDIRAGKVKRNWSFVIWGLYSMVDSEATATTSENLMEAVLNELSTFENITLDRNANSSEPAELVENTLAGFGKMVVHRYKIRKRVLDIVST